MFPKGHAWLLGNDPVRKMLDLKREYGAVFRFDLGHVPSVILTRHEDIVDLYNREELNGRGWSLMDHQNSVFPEKIDGENI